MQYGGTNRGKAHNSLNKLWPGAMNSPYSQLFVRLLFPWSLLMTVLYLCYGVPQRTAKDTTIFCARSFSALATVNTQGSWGRPLKNILLQLKQPHQKGERLLRRMQHGAARSIQWNMGGRDSKLLTQFPKFENISLKINQRNALNANSVKLNSNSMVALRSCTKTLNTYTLEQVSKNKEDNRDQSKKYKIVDNKNNPLIAALAFCTMTCKVVQCCKQWELVLCLYWKLLTKIWITSSTSFAAWNIWHSMHVIQLYLTGKCQNQSNVQWVSAVTWIKRRCSRYL